MKGLFYYINRTAVIFFISAYLIQPAHAARLDCKKAKSDVERLICSDNELSAFDETLNDVYLKALNREDIKNFVVGSQIQWVRNKRDKCIDKQCLKDAYSIRIGELRTAVSFGIAPTREPYFEGTGDKQIHFGSPVLPASQEPDTLLPLSTSQPPRDLAAGSEIVLISGYEPTNKQKIGAIVKVDIDRPGSKVLLILTSYEKVNWEISASPATKISGIITSGYERPYVTTSVPTQGYLAKLPYTYETENVNFRNMLDQLNRMFGVNKVDAFRGSYTIPAAIKISALDPSRVELTQEGQQPQRPHNNFSFELLGKDYRKQLWTLTGPEIPFESNKNVINQKAASSNASGIEYENSYNFTEERAVVTKNGNEIYRLGREGLEILHPHEANIEKAALPPNFPEFSWASGIAYDTKRDIVTVATFGGEGFLYRFNTKSKTWIDYRSLSNIDICSLAYDKTKDRYVAWGTFVSEGQLIFISGDGTALFTRKVLPKLDGFGRLYDRGNRMSPCPRIAPNGDEIALVFMNRNSVNRIWCYYVESDSALFTYKSD